MEHSRLVQACTGVALPLYKILKITPFGALGSITFTSSFGENGQLGTNKHTHRLKVERERNGKDKTIFDIVRTVYRVSSCNIYAGHTS